MSANRVLATPRFFDDGTRRFLEASGCEVVVADLDPDRGDAHFTPGHLIGLASGARGWLLGQAWVGHDVMAALPDLCVIARRGVGHERVDLDAARALGITVTVGAGGNDASTADHALALMLAVGRRLRESQARLQAGQWGILVGSELYAKTVGIVGLGRVARGVIQRLRGFSCDILVSTPRPDPAFAAAFGVRYVGLPDLLSASDIVSLHLPLREDTRNLIDAEALALMKPGALLVNTARGGLIDETALLAALEAGRLGGAGLDVFMAETDPAFRPVAEALIAHPNVVATPHAAGSTHEALVRTNMIAARSIVAILSGQAPDPETVVVAGHRRP